MSTPDLSIFKVPSGCVISRLPFSPEQLEIFNAVLKEDRDDYPNTRIASVVKEEWNISIKRTALSLHRREKCVCYDKPLEAK